MGELYKFPEKRESKEIEAIYRREFGYVVCPHKVYLPNQFCSPCADMAAKELGKILFGDISE
jgi:hypothetical protein